MEKKETISLLRRRIFERAYHSIELLRKKTATAKWCEIKNHNFWKLFRYVIVFFFTRHASNVATSSSSSSYLIHSFECFTRTRTHIHIESYLSGSDDTISTNLFAPLIQTIWKTIWINAVHISRVFHSGIRKHFFLSGTELRLLIWILRS